MGHFAEATLPTSMVWACMVHQCSAGRKELARRRLAARVFHDLLTASFRTGAAEIEIQTDNMTERFRLPVSGVVKASVLTDHLTQQQRTALQSAWADDCLARC